MPHPCIWVMNALDQLQNQGRKVVLISHIQEMHERILQIQVRPLGAGARWCADLARPNLHWPCITERLICRKCWRRRILPFRPRRAARCIQFIYCCANHASVINRNHWPNGAIRPSGLLKVKEATVAALLLRKPSIAKRCQNEAHNRYCSVTPFDR